VLYHRSRAADEEFSLALNLSTRYAYKFVSQKERLRRISLARRNLVNRLRYVCLISSKGIDFSIHLCSAQSIQPVQSSSLSRLQYLQLLGSVSSFFTQKKSAYICLLFQRA